MTQIQGITNIPHCIARRIAKLFPSNISTSDYPFLNLSGYTSLIILYSTLSRIYNSEEWDLLLHCYITNVVRILESQGVTRFSLIDGLAGICFAITLSGQEKGRYKKLQNTLDLFLIKGINQDYLIPLQKNINGGLYSNQNLYDVISGVTGIGNYFLNNLEKKGFVEIVKEILSTLVSFCSPIIIHGREVPGWYRHTEDTFEDKSRFPKGNFDLGFAHGIPGILAFFSLALLKGVIVNRQKETILKLTDWIWDKRLVGAQGIFWSDRVSFEEETTGKKENNSFIFDGWCYGTPGITRSLFLAGSALDDKQIKNQSIKSFKDVFLKTREQWGLPCPSFCHGLSGLLTLTCKMYQETSLPFFRDKSNELKSLILSFYNPLWELGFFSDSISDISEYLRSERINIITGVSGILLSLLFCDFYKEDKWTRFFVIS